MGLIKGNTRSLDNGSLGRHGYPTETVRPGRVTRIGPKSRVEDPSTGDVEDPLTGEKLQNLRIAFGSFQNWGPKSLCNKAGNSLVEVQGPAN